MLANRLGCLRGWSHIVQGFLACGFLAVLIFSRSLYPCLLAAVGLLVSLETIAAVDRDNQRMLAFFGVYMMVNIVVSIALGTVVLANVDNGCVSAENPGTCRTVAAVTGFIVSVGGSLLGVIALLASQLPIWSVQCCAARRAGSLGGAALLRNPEKLAQDIAEHKLGGLIGRPQGR